MLGAAQIHCLLERNGLGARRSLGQNFVTDPGTLRRIVALSGVGPGSRVLEVGPGVGSLTLALVEAGADVLALEKDEQLLPVLEEVLQRVPLDRRPTVILGDALGADWPALLGNAVWTVVANLPYNVAVPIIIELLEGAPMVERMWVMVQLEVAERLCASPGGRSIGVPTVKVGWFASARIVMTVSPEVFTPQPRVRSAVVEILRRPSPAPGLDPQSVFSLVSRAYGQRRKMLRSSLGAEVSPSTFMLAGVDPRARPEQLALADWASLAAAVKTTGPGS